MRQPPVSWKGAPRQEASGKARVLNVPPDIFDGRDHVYTPRPTPLPSEFWPSVQKGDVRDQGEEGACTGFALAAVVNAQLRRRGLREQVSPRFLYENARRYDEWRGQGYEGSSLRGAMKGFFKHGACSEGVLPYRSGSREPIPEAAYVNAQIRPLGAYYRIPTSSINALQCAILEAGAILASGEVHEGWTGLVETEQERMEIPWAGQRTLGGHAFALVGFDARGFVVQNSWGPKWGRGGLARLTYEDWLANRMDAWVAQVGVGRVNYDSGPGRTKVNRRGQVVAMVREDQIRGHYLAVEDGTFDTHGPVHSRPEDLPELAERIQAFGRQRGLARVPVLLFAHGGLVGEEDAAGKTLDFRDTLLANGIYPLHILWHTGFWETVSDLVLPRRPDRGPVTFALRDLVDDALEVATRPLGRALWRDMKHDAEAAVRGPRLSGGGPVAGLVEALVQAGPLPLDLHLVGHSAGSILQSHLVSWCAGRGHRVASLSFFAPAASVDLFKAKALPHIGPGKVVERFDLVTMSDQDEREDQVGRVYSKSLLYFVSGAFEERSPERLLGLARHIHQDYQGRTSEVDTSLAQWLQDKVTWHRPNGAGGTLHGSFDDDPPTINAWMSRVLGHPPLRPYGS